MVVVVMVRRKIARGIDIGHPGDPIGADTEAVEQGCSCCTTALDLDWVEESGPNYTQITRIIQGIQDPWWPRYGQLRPLGTQTFFMGKRKRCLRDQNGTKHVDDSAME